MGVTTITSADLLVQAYVLRSADMPDEALERCSAVLDARYDEEAAALAASILNDFTDANRAVAFLSPHVERHPRCLALLRACARHLNTVGRTNEAIARFRDILKIAPSDTESATRLARILIIGSRAEEAQGVFDHLMEAGVPKRAVANLAARLFAESGHSTLAEHFLQRAEAAGPPDTEQNHLSSAIRQAQIPVRAAPDYVRTLFDRHAAGFDENLNAVGYRGPAIIEHALRDLDLDAPKLSVLDAGCGTGLCGGVLRPFAAHLTGIDLSDKMLSAARATGQYDALARLDAIEAGDTFPGVFDCVISADVLGYFGALESVLNSLRRCLRPGGTLIFTLEAATEDAGSGFELRPSGRYRHHPDYVSSSLRNAGFEVTPSISCDTLRYEYEQPVDALCVVQPTNR